MSNHEIAVESNESSPDCIKKFFGEHYRAVKIDSNLVTRLHRYRVNYAMAHHDFLLGAAIGTVNLYFKDSDVLELYRILDVIPINIERDRDNCPNIPTFKITGDIYNLTLFYLAYRFMSSSLSPKLKEVGARECLLLFN